MCARRLLAVALLALTGAACGAGPPDEEARPAPGRQSPGPETLADVARPLVPPSAGLYRVDEEFAVKECGIRPVYPCVRAYFVVADEPLDERLALVRRLARQAGWRIVSTGRDRGVTLAMRRGRYAATYMLEADDRLLCAAAGRCLTGTMLTVYGPPAVLPHPSAAQRDRWSAEKRAFVRAANAVCARMDAGMRMPAGIPAALARGLAGLSALRAPPGEEAQATRVLRPLRGLVRAARALDRGGEDALPAAVAAGELARRFDAEASRYGLGVCARVG